MPSPGIIQGHAALWINSFPVAGAKIFCFADQWSLAVGKARSVSCFHGRGTVSAVCALGRVCALWDLRLCPRHLHSGPGKSQVWKGKRENVLPCLACARSPRTRVFLLCFGEHWAGNFLPSSHSVQVEMPLGSAGGSDAALSLSSKLWH